MSRSLIGNLRKREENVRLIEVMQLKWILQKVKFTGIESNFRGKAMLRDTRFDSPFRFSSGITGCFSVKWIFLIIRLKI